MAPSLKLGMSDREQGCIMYKIFGPNPMRARASEMSVLLVLVMQKGLKASPVLAASPYHWYWPSTGPFHLEPPMQSWQLVSARATSGEVFCAGQVLGGVCV